MSRLARRMFARIFDKPRTAPASRRAADLRVRPLLQALEARDVPATFTVTNAADSGDGSLRKALLDANAAAGADTVVFDSTFFATARTITLTGGQLEISDSVTVTGPGAARVTVSG